MSKYTTQIRFICESLAGFTESRGFDDIENIIETAAPQIFSFDYPIFDPLYKLPLEKKILKHYYTREISEETFGLWKLRLDSRMNEIMPYYNELYKSTLLDFNPFNDVDLSKTAKRENESENLRDKTNDLTVDNDSETTRNITDGGSVTENGESENTETQSAEGWNLFSDTPQGGIRGINGAEDDPALGSNAYLTNATKTKDDRNNTATQTANNTRTQNLTRTENATDSTNRTESGVEHETGETKSTEDYIEKITGKNGGVSYSKLLLEFRETFLNIDKLIIDELSDLFFGLWE